MLTPAGQAQIIMDEKRTTHQLPTDARNQTSKLIIHLTTEETMDPSLESTTGSSEDAKAAVDEIENSAKANPNMSISEDAAAKNLAKNTKESEKIKGQVSETFPSRPKVTRANSYFEVKEHQEGRPCVQRFRSLLDRNMAANPGCSH